MPCLILTGHPQCGKTYIAHKIKQYVQESHNSVHDVVIINEEAVCDNNKCKQEFYDTPLHEQQTRGALKSAFDRAVANSNNNNILVILDSLNYIKGFRYELFCIAKAARQSYAVVWIRSSSLTNTNDEHSEYSDDLYKALLARYETPDERNRWDRPLYQIDVCGGATTATTTATTLYNMHNVQAGVANTRDDSAAPTTMAVPKKKKSAFKRAQSNKIKPTSDNNKNPFRLTADALASLQEEAPAALKQKSSSTPPVTEPKHKNGTTMLDERIATIVDDFLHHTPPLQEGVSTRQHVASHSDSLFDFHSITNSIVTDIVSYQQRHPQARLIRLDSNDDDNLTLACSRALTLSELRTFRQHYLDWVANHPPSSASRTSITKSFLQYIESQL